MAINRFGQSQTPISNPFRRLGASRPSQLRGVRFTEAIAFIRLLASYDCAGVDQDEPNDTRVCGKCGPCRAAEWLREIGYGEP